MEAESVESTEHDIVTSHERSPFLHEPEVSYEHLLLDFVKHRTISSDQTTHSGFSREQLAVLQRFHSQPNVQACLGTVNNPRPMYRKHAFLTCP